MCKFSLNIFNSYTSNICINKQLNIVQIDTLSQDMKQLIDNHIIKIMYGKDEILGGVKRCKTNFLNFIKKKDIKKQIGFISEFFIHLYLYTLGYTQECILKNLEENSLKKGFDGIYSLENEMWILESKSGNNDTSSIKHKKKILESINDLSNKIAGNTSNDPWMNALHHLEILHGKENNDIINIIEQLSFEYDENIEHYIDDFNTIYASTIFYRITFHDDNEQVEEEIKSIVSDIKGLSSNIICINYKIFNEFIDYLKEK